MDVGSDITATESRLRIFSLIGEVTRGCFTLEVDVSITGQYVSRYLSEAILFRGRSLKFPSDNIPEIYK